MKINKLILLLLISSILLYSACNTNPKELITEDKAPYELPKSRIDFNPEEYICYRASEIIIDGLLDEESWQNAEWTNDFVDIEGDVMPLPLHKTNAKMLWDDEYLYIAAEIYEPHIWAYLRQRDTVIFYDNDFEVFIDPDGDTHGYYEFEMNALNTLWDLLLTRPYRDYGKVLNAWNITGIKTAVKIYGTLNDPADIDEKWVVELAFPLSVLSEWGNQPVDGRQWRVNFSRVNWRTVIEDGMYKKEIDPKTGKRFPEYNWVWSPQGIINLHAPETWAYLQFSEILAGKGKTEFIPNPEEVFKWNLRKLYFAQRVYFSANGEYASETSLLNTFDYSAEDLAVEILIKPTGYEAYLKSTISNKLWVIDNTGRVYSIPIK